MTIENLIKILANSGERVYSEVCKVISVDQDERTCEVEPVSGGADIPSCRLQASLSLTDGLVLFPKQNSFVIVSWLSKNSAFVSMCSQVDEIRLNGDQYGGLVIYDRLKSEIDKNSQFLNQLKQILDSWAPVAQDGGAALKTAWAAISSTVQTADLSDIINDTVKHG